MSHIVASVANWLTRVIVHSRERTGELLVDDVSVGRVSDGIARVSATAGELRLDYIDVPGG